MGRLRLRFDALASHDITYVGVIQTAKASGDVYKRQLPSGGVGPRRLDAIQLESANARHLDSELSPISWT